MYHSSSSSSMGLKAQREAKSSRVVLFSTKAAAVVGGFVVGVVSVAMMALVGLFLGQEAELLSSSRSSIHPTVFILDIMGGLVVVIVVEEEGC